MNMKKTYDCVEMKQAGAEQIRNTTEGMTRTQLLEYWRTRSLALRERQQRLLEQAKETAIPSKL